MEQALVDAVAGGRLLDLTANGEMIDEAAMRGWSEARSVRAAVLRDIVRGRLAGDPDPRGLRLCGARIIGRPDLANVTSRVSLELVDCLLEEGIAARCANLTALTLTRCRLEHPTLPPLDGERLTNTVGMSLAGTVISGHGERGAVRLVEAQLGHLDCSAATLRNCSGPALHAEGANVEQQVLLADGFHATGASASGAVRFAVARVVGVDLALPVIDAGVRNQCNITTSATGQALDTASWALQLLAWAFATLFIAGFTGIIRRT